MQINAQWGEYRTKFTKPFVDLIELNIATVNNLTKEARYIEDLLQATKLEEVVSAQMKLASTTSTEMVKYTLGVCGIIQEFFTQASQVVTDIVHDKTKKTSA